MAKPGNALIQISKKLAALQIKSAKISEEIKALSDSVAVEVKKQESAPVSATKTVPAKAVPAKAAPGKAPIKSVPAKAAPAKVAPAKANGAPAGTSTSASGNAASKKRGRPSKK